MKFKHIYAGIVILCIFLLPQLVMAEQIDHYRITIDVQESGEIDITESIEYNFGNEQRRGILRNIPLVKENQDRKKFKMDISDVRVTNEVGEPYTVQESEESGEYRLRVGDPEIYITGTHTYVVTYTLAGALTYFPEFDELFWNAIGTDWDVPIDFGEVTISLPQGVQENTIEANCYQGSYGSTDSSCSAIVSGNSVYFQASQLLAGEALSVVIGFPKGYVEVLEPEPITNFFETPLGFVVLGLLIIVGVIWYVLFPLYIPYMWYVKGRDPHVGKPVTAWFDPPKTEGGRLLSPAETGTLIDEHFEPRELLATIIHLAQKEHLKIIEKKKHEFELVQHTEPMPGSLQPFEEEVYNGLFGSSKTTSVSLKTFDWGSLNTKVASNVYVSLVDEAYFADNPDSVRKKWYIVAGVGAVTGNILLAIIAFVFGRAMPRKTLHGAESANVAKSLKNFLQSQERQLNFQGDKQMMFEKLLPYAIAFGVEKQWMKRFEQIPLQQPGWYSSTNSNFSNIALASFINNVGKQYNSGYQSSVSSSSGFSSGSSGGFSGGGGGGGGGGSW